MNDIITTLNRPEWPVTQLVLEVLARVCVKNFRSDSSDFCITFRVACVEYFGIITSKFYQLCIIKPKSHKDDVFLDQLLECFDSSYPVPVKAKAMRCLSQIIEVDHKILAIVLINFCK